MSHLNRHPAGTPHGGQFAPSGRNEPDASLIDLEPLPDPEWEETLPPDPRSLTIREALDYDPTLVERCCASAAIAARNLCGCGGPPADW